MRASKAASRVGVAPPGRRWRARRSQASGPRSLLEQVEDRAAEDDRVAARGGERGPRALAQAADHRRPVEADLAREVLGAAFDQPGPAQVAGEAARGPGGGQLGVVGGDDELRVEALGGAAQRLARVLAGGAALHVGVVEHVQLGRHRPAGQVAPPGRRRRPARRRQEGMGHRQPGRVGVDDDSDLARHPLEAILEPQPQFLHPVEHPLGEGGVAAVVARRKAQRLRLDPRHRAEATCCCLRRGRARLDRKR